MSKQKRIPLILIFFIILSISLTASEKILMKLEGSYLAYSYDNRQIYGENVKFNFFSYEVSCQYIKIDVTSRTFYAYGNVVLKKEDEIISGDELLFDPLKNIGKLISYKEGVEVKKIGDEDSEIPLSKNNILDELSLSKIQKSFLYFTGQLFQINKDFEVYGFNVTLYLEGLESLGFKKFRLSGGINQRNNGFSLDRIWYTKTQGLISRASYFYKKENKINSLTQLNYEEHSVLKDYPGGLKRQVDVMSSTTVNFNKNLNLGLTGNYNSSNLWNARVWLNKKWGNKVNTQVDVLYNKPINLKGETWLGFQSIINANKLGNISFAGKYEIQNQVLSSFSYRNTFLKRINFLLSSSYSKVKIGQSGDYSEILSGGVNLSYSSRIFNLSTDYYLNYDLFGDQLLSQPQLRLGLNPFQFYGGLLSLSIYNVFIYNDLRGEIHDYNYSNNTIFNLSTKPIFVQKSFSVNFNIALEQFVEKEDRNFTSGGFIINVKKGILKGVSLEGFYNIQSRRKTKSWLIEGTTSQDLSTVLKVNPSKSLNAWLSFSFDPKKSQWRQSFANLSLELFRNWKFNSLLNYDFILKKINNVDLYIIRDAGQFQLRFIWRSLSKQFVVELVPR